MNGGNKLFASFAMYKLIKQFLESLGRFGWIILAAQGRRLP
jgi:hypothetical protein